MADPQALVAAADLLHKLALERLNQLMDTVAADSSEAEELASLADAIQAYERERFADDFAR